MDTNTIKETVIAIPKEPESAVDITALPEIAFFMQKLALNIWIFHVKRKKNSRMKNWINSSTSFRTAQTGL